VLFFEGIFSIRVIPRNPWESFLLPTRNLELFLGNLDPVAYVYPTFLEPLLEPIEAEMD